MIVNNGGGGRSGYQVNEDDFPFMVDYFVSSSASSYSMASTSKAFQHGDCLIHIEMPIEYSSDREGGRATLLFKDGKTSILEDVVYSKGSNDEQVEGGSGFVSINTDGIGITCKGSTRRRASFCIPLK